MSFPCAFSPSSCIIQLENVTLDEDRRAVISNKDDGRQPSAVPLWRALVPEIDGGYECCMLAILESFERDRASAASVSEAKRQLRT